MKLPRDITGNDLAKALDTLGYRVTRQTGSHIRLSTPVKYEGLKRVFLLGNLLEIELARDVGMKPMYCWMSIASEGYPEILHPRYDQTDWHIVLSMSASL